MTPPERKEFNAMDVQLNKAIEDAVSQNKDQGVTWIPIDGELNGHRFCEPGLQEPEQHNSNLWLWHYPYNEPNNDKIDGPLQRSSTRLALLECAFYMIWRGIGDRAKVFHSQISLHEKIRDMILNTYISDLGGSGATLSSPVTTSTPSPSPSRSPSPNPSPPEKDACHG
ncbi:SGNH hydrolase-type esterase domain-containing protein [Rutstroemia sp. NJR-2017a WRK4]|nr:SGNH hydrolase-type esterase domain-containing protein [Rutstroemia sp. NJR-2017a WRK4]